MLDVLLNLNSLSANPAKWSHSNNVGKSRQILEFVWPFCGVGVWRLTLFWFLWYWQINREGPQLQAWLLPYQFQQNKNIYLQILFMLLFNMYMLDLCYFLTCKCLEDFFSIETSHLICWPYQLTGTYMSGKGLYRSFWSISIWKNLRPDFSKYKDFLGIWVWTG